MEGVFSYLEAENAQRICPLTREPLTVLTKQGIPLCASCHEARREIEVFSPEEISAGAEEALGKLAELKDAAETKLAELMEKKDDVLQMFSEKAEADKAQKDKLDKAAEDVEHDLKIIDQAIEIINEAIDKDPTILGKKNWEEAKKKLDIEREIRETAAKEQEAYEKLHAEFEKSENDARHLLFHSVALRFVAAGAPGAGAEDHLALFAAAQLLK